MNATEHRNRARMNGNGVSNKDNVITDATYKCY